MSHHPITMFELASARRADLLREAAAESVAQQAKLDDASHSRPFRGSFDVITVALRHRQRVTATRIRRHLWTLPA